MTVNPYDIKSVVLAKHAQHVVLIHFPIALFPAREIVERLAASLAPMRTPGVAGRRLRAITD